jgi:hypothetical protein
MHLSVLFGKADLKKADVNFQPDEAYQLQIQSPLPKVGLPPDGKLTSIHVLVLGCKPCGHAPAHPPRPHTHLSRHAAGAKVKLTIVAAENLPSVVGP